MGAGQYRNLVTIEQPDPNVPTLASGTPDPSKPWLPVKVVNVSVRSLQGAELFNSEQIQGRREVMVEMRYTATPPLTPTMRIHWNDNGQSRYLNFAEAPSDPDGRRRVLRVKCYEQVA